MMMQGIHSPRPRPAATQTAGVMREESLATLARRSACGTRVALSKTHRFSSLWVGRRSRYAPSVSTATSVGTCLRHLVLAALLIGWAVPFARGSTLELTDGVVIAKGNRVFARYCSVGYCHGAEGRSGLGPALSDRVWDPQELFETVGGGRPGTSMPPFQENLYPEDIWSIVAYVISLGSVKPGTSTAVEFESTARPSDLLSEQARRGRSLFFDLTNEKRCSLCHQLEGNGTPIGPNLAALAKSESAEKLRRHILEPNGAIAEGFEQTVITTSEGERIAGVTKERTDELIRIYDAASIPSPLRTFYRDEIRSVETQERSSMPDDYGDFYLPEEVAAIIAYLRAGVF
jgi:putative heme-binding domain-containing protein